MSVCPIHQLPWKTVPAGVSRTTGQPYNAFLACQVQGCKQRPPRQAPAPQPLNPRAAEESRPAPFRSPKDARWAACLSFAGTLYRGSGSEMLEEVLALAQRVYREWPE